MNLKDPVFGPFLVHFPNFGGKKILPDNLALSRTTSYRFLAPFQNLEKTNDTIPRKRLDRWKDGQTGRRTKGRKDGKTIFIGPFRLPPIINHLLNHHLTLF